MKRIISLVILAVFVAAMGIPAFANEPGNDSFTDISGHWAGSYIAELADGSLFDGIFDENLFKPDTAITRSEFAALLHKASGITIVYLKAPDINEFFDDVSNEASYAGLLYDLATVGIIDYKGSFRPESTLTREELVHFTMNTFRYMTGNMEEKPVGADEIPFEDKSEISSAFKADISRAFSQEIIAGRKDGKFHPKDSATRAEAAVIIKNLMKRLDAGRDVAVNVSYKKDGDFFDMILEITNNSDEEVAINHSSGQKYDFRLLDADRNILYTWSADKLFIMALTTTTIAPGETKRFTERLEYESQGEILDKAAYLQAFITGRSEAFKVNPEGYTVEIK